MFEWYIVIILPIALSGFIYDHYNTISKRKYNIPIYDPYTNTYDNGFKDKKIAKISLKILRALVLFWFTVLFIRSVAVLIYRIT